MSKKQRSDVHDPLDPATPAPPRECVLLLAAPPAVDGHLQGVVGGEHGGHQREVGHGTGAVLGADPAGDGFPFVRVSVCWRRASVSAQQRDGGRGGVSGQRLPAAMTGSLISSLVIGHRNSQGIPEEKESLLSSSTLLHSLFRRPTDSAQQRNNCHAKGPRWAVSVLEEWEVWVQRAKNNSSPLWSRPLLSTNSRRSRLHHLLSLHSTRDGFVCFKGDEASRCHPPSVLLCVFHRSIMLPLHANPSSPTQPPRNCVSAMKGAINVKATEEGTLCSRSESRA